MDSRVLHYAWFISNCFACTYYVSHHMMLHMSQSSSFAAIICAILQPFFLNGKILVCFSTPPPTHIFAYLPSPYPSPLNPLLPSPLTPCCPHPSPLNPLLPSPLTPQPPAALTPQPPAALTPHPSTPCYPHPSTPCCPHPSPPQPPATLTPQPPATLTPHPSPPGCPHPSPPHHPTHAPSVPSDTDLVSSMALRLTTVERELLAARRELIEKVCLSLSPMDRGTVHFCVGQPRKLIL